MAMAEFTLRIRRFLPESGDAPYWQEFDVDLEGHRSVLEGILTAKAEEDGSIGIRCSCRAAICGSCGVRSTASRAGLQHPPGVGGRALARRTARSSSSRWATCP